MRKRTKWNSSLPDKEFKVMAIKMLIRLDRKIGRGGEP